MNFDVSPYRYNIKIRGDVKILVVVPTILWLKKHMSMKSLQRNALDKLKGKKQKVDLLPIGSYEGGVFEARGIPVAILPSC